MKFIIGQCKECGAVLATAVVHSRDKTLAEDVLSFVMSNKVVRLIKADSVAIGQCSCEKLRMRR